MATVRRLGPEDWRAFRDLRLRSLADAPDAFGSTLAREQHLTERDWRSLLSGPVMVVDDPEPVALGGTFTRDDVLHVWGMWTDPSYRGRGHARSVLDALLPQGCRAQLDVNVDNDRARALYERYGFVGTGHLQPLRPGSVQQIERMVLSRRG